MEHKMETIYSTSWSKKQTKVTIVTCVDDFCAIALPNRQLNMHSAGTEAADKDKCSW